MAIFLAIALTLTAFTFWFKKIALGFGAVFGWLLVGVYAFTLSEATWDVNYGLFWFGMGMVVVTAILLLGMREKEDVLEEKDETDAFIEERDVYEEGTTKYRRATRPRARRRRLSSFEKRMKSFGRKR